MLTFKKINGIRTGIEKRKKIFETRQEPAWIIFLEPSLQNLYKQIITMAIPQIHLTLLLKDSKLFLYNQYSSA